MPPLKRNKAKDQPAPTFNPVRFRLVCLGVLGCLVFLLASTADLQLINHPMLEKQADERSLRTVTLPTNRGTLLDRNGEALALSVPSRDIIADPQRVLEAHPDFTSDKWEYLANALDQRPEQLAAQINANPNRRFLYLGRKIELGIAKDIAKLHLTGITTVYDDSRFYPMSEATGPLLGIVGADNTGLTGLEKGFDKLLQGTPGVEKYRQDANGNIVAMINYEPPKQPPTVQLSIDKFDQYTMYSKLRDGVILNKADSGAAVLIKIDTGEILGMASYPSFNPNNFVDVSPMQMRNTAINDSYEPGSTVKPLVVMEGLIRKLVRPDSVLDTTPYRVNGHLIRDVGHWPRLTMTGILQKSSDIGVSHIALAMPAEVLVNTYHSFGLGKPTGLGLTGESVGYFPLHRERWADIERATFSFGYGLRVTPLQIAREYATLGSFGVYRPLSITKVSPPVMGTRVAPEDTVRSVVHMMESDALPGGSGVRAAVPGYRLAIKTGTAEKMGDSGKYDGGYINYTAGVAPASNPQVALVIMINHPTAGDHFGGSVAAPVFGNIIGPVLKHMNIAPDALNNHG
ncbi:peptidoglycan synthase [bacteria symbiont BFo1 of Frankliniella occidentalis]|uniref:Peptidoglycan D,D-transpeptidase FtsI n=1 Tax=Erwinia aphidicola TaxID=68334 RepID=A0ABU8DDQ8_ERWAP|nr:MULTISPECIES: penicillin-binding transpeptidase domain-containing protein [Erwinia]KMV69070.1 peptidoglycan synthase [bacteria symbiont BFo1 of Frankliniella occidentalis]PIJ59900.1 peptidoglycan synthase [Erwinia sp. OLMDLW33]VTT27939.1 cell division protein FtsI [Klebsiella pneumoniae]KYP83554.1 peptidoglycan synthase [bacteria symbiont BFo1 of Frankliniella occidentalis]KYP88822.1 peptidoglycan synthase [bacteria symbiont BFo1 of Frankliniella occidentalis]